jgi:hypothetical protein
MRGARPSKALAASRHAQQTCSILAPVDARGPRSLATSRVNISIIIPKRLRESAASHRPLDDSSRMKACCAWTSMNWGVGVSGTRGGERESAGGRDKGIEG